jgi:integrase
VADEIELKSNAGRRRVPIVPLLRDFLIEHRMSTGGDHGFAFGSDTPFNSKLLIRRADAAWEAAGLERITLHECRHTFASLMIAAGVNGRSACRSGGY